MPTCTLEQRDMAGVLEVHVKVLLCSTAGIGSEALDYGLVQAIDSEHGLLPQPVCVGCTNSCCSKIRYILQTDQACEAQKLSSMTHGCVMMLAHTTGVCGLVQGGLDHVCNNSHLRQVHSTPM